MDINLINTLIHNKYKDVYEMPACYVVPYLKNGPENKSYVWEVQYSNSPKEISKVYNRIARYHFNGHSFIEGQKYDLVKAQNLRTYTYSEVRFSMRVAKAIFKTQVGRDFSAKTYYTLKLPDTITTLLEELGLF